MKDYNLYIFLFLLGATHLNLLIAIVARIKTSFQSYNELILYWFFLIITYLAAALMNQSEDAIAFSFFFQIFPVLVMSKILHVSRGTKFYLFWYTLTFSIGAILSTYFLILTDIGFSISLLPLCVAISVPLLLPAFGTLVTNWKSSNWIEKFLGFIYITGVINIFNFAFFRLKPEAAFWGWGISIAQYQCLSIFVPLLIHHKRNILEKKNLENMLQKISGMKHSQFQKAEELYQRLETEIEQKKHLTDLLLEERLLSDKLLKTVTHDLASPIMVISSYLNMIKSGRIPKEDFHNTIEKIKNNTESALSHIEKIRENITKKRTPSKLLK